MSIIYVHYILNDDPISHQEFQTGNTIGYNEYNGGGGGDDDDGDDDDDVQ